jgi:hypothetical protein
LPKALAEHFLKNGNIIPEALTGEECMAVLKLMEMFADNTINGSKHIIDERVKYLRQKKIMEKATETAKAIAKAAG